MKKINKKIKELGLVKVSDKDFNNLEIQNQCAMNDMFPSNEDLFISSDDVGGNFVDTIYTTEKIPSNIASVFKLAFELADSADEVDLVLVDGNYGLIRYWWD